MGSFNRVAFAPVSLLAVSTFAFAQLQSPEAGGAVSDLAGKLTPTTTQRLEGTITQFDARSGIDLRVVTLPMADLRGHTIEEYSIGLARRWAVGRGSGGRGLLLVVAIGPKDKSGTYHGATRLEVSRNLQSAFPNRLSSEVTRKMRDSLMAGWFDEAITIGVDGIVSSIDETQRVTGQSSAGSPARSPAAPPSPVGFNVGEYTIGWGTASFGIVSTLIFLALPAIIIAAIVRRFVGGSGYRTGGAWNRRMRGSGRGMGMVTGISSRTNNWSDTNWNANSASMDSGSADWRDSTSSSSSDDSSSNAWSSSGSDDSSCSSSSDSSSSSGSADDWSSSSSSSDSSSSSSCDSSSSSSSSDSGGGGSTDSW